MSDETRRVDVTVVGGAGHVGVPLSLSLAASGLTVNINDLNRHSLDTLAAGRLPFIEHEAEDLLTHALAERRLVFTNGPADVSQPGPVIVTIGTPVDEFLNPDYGRIRSCVDSLLPHLADGQLVVLRSTVYPGTTEWLHSYFERQRRDLKIAYCPERVVQGFGIQELREMPQIVSATSPQAETEAAQLFERITPELVFLPPREAEIMKLFNNAYRYIEFAVTNQFYLISKAAGLDYQRILRAMKHNYPRAKNIPGPGFSAGPCLMKDTMQLAAFARNEFSLGNAAMLVNEGLVLNVVADLHRRYNLAKMTIGLLGMAFKAEIDDIRASLSYKFKKALSEHVGTVLSTDPFVTVDPDLLPLDEVVRRSDLLILCTPHKCYKHAGFAGKPVVDVWGFLENAQVIA